MRKVVIHMMTTLNGSLHKPAAWAYGTFDISESGKRHDNKKEGDFNHETFLFQT